MSESDQSDIEKVAEYFGIITSILLPIMPIPQIIKIIRIKSGKELSIYYILFQLLANLCFLIFGALKNEIYVIIPNALLIFMNIVIIVMKYFFDICYDKSHYNENCYNENCYNGNCYNENCYNGNCYNEICCNINCCKKRTLPTQNEIEIEIEKSSSYDRTEEIIVSDNIV